MTNTIQILKAGPVRVEYENGFLRGLTLYGVEVVRMIYFAVRDVHWQTARLTIQDETVEQSVDSFRVDYRWETHDLDIDMAGRVTITGEADGQITFDFAGEALAPFLKNRVGICVLHPLEGVVGQPCQVETADGQLAEGWFPDLISPHQPFLNISTLRWQPVSGSALKLMFWGDVFEMEDQRNWTDASFKTYSTPLALPFPVAMQPGETVGQQVVFSPEQTWPTTDTAKTCRPAAPRLTVSDGEKAISVGSHKLARPRLGLGQRADWQPLRAFQAAPLRVLHLSHLRADVVFLTPDWPTGLTNALADARLLDVRLELALFFGPDPVAELTRLTQFLAAYRERVGSVLLFDAATLTTSNSLLDQVAQRVRSYWPAVLLGGGTDGAFAEFNRNRFAYHLVDFVVYSISPQVHATDERTLLENIDGQAPTVQTARQLTGNKPVHISPVTLRPRYMTAVQAHSNRRSPPADSRQFTEFGANWTQLTIDTLTQSGVASMTFYETHGSRGVVNGSASLPV